MNAKSRVFPVGLALIALPMVPLAAQAQGTPAAGGDAVEEMVVTATRIATPVTRIPAAVSLVTRADIQTYSWQTLPDALATLPGATVVRSGGPGGNTSLFLRGTNSSHALVLLDGMPANDPSLAAGAFNFGDDTLAGIQRIEVVRGPASTLYGSNAIGGVVNLISRTGADRPPAAELDLGLGTDRTLRGSAGLYGTVDRLDYGVTLEGFSTRGDDATPARLRGASFERDGFENTSATAKAVYRLDTARVEGLVRWREARFDADNPPDNDPNSEGRSEQLAWQAAGELDLLGGSLTSRLALGQALYDRRFTNPADAANPGSGDDRFNGSRTHLDWQNSYALPGIPALQDAVVMAGATWVREQADVSILSRSGFGDYTQAVDAGADTLALFAHGQARLAGRVTVTAGLRHDRPEDYDSHTTWRLGAVLALPEAGARLTAAAGTAFKAPDLYDRYGVNNFGYRGNPDLRPETSFGWEAGVEVDLPLAGRADFATLGAVYFANEIEDLIQYDFARNTAVNVSEAETEGLEATLALRPADSVELLATWTWTDARNAQTGARLLRRPETGISLSGRISPLPGLTLAPEAQFVGQRIDYVYPTGGGWGANGRVGGYWLVNLAATYAITADVELYGRMTNVADRTIENPSGFAQPDRGALVGLRGRF